MKTAIAKLNTYRQSPRKVRLVADLVRGKRVDQAINALKFTNKRSTGPIIKLIESAVANAKNLGLNADHLVVDKITVDGGQVLKRHMPMSRGRAFQILKRTSHIMVSVSEVEPKEKKEKKVKAEKKTKVVKETAKAENK